MKNNRLYAFLILGLLFAACEGEPSDNGKNNKEDINDKTEESIRPGDPITVVDGKVRFYLAESDNSVRQAAGISTFDWSAFRVSISGVDYPILLTENGEPYIEADAAASYNAVLYREESAMYYGLSRYVNVVIPPMSFYHCLTKDIDALPLYGSYSSEDGNVLKMTPLVAAVKLTLSGDAKISSIKIDAGVPISGIGSYQASKKKLSITKALPFTVLNCTNRGTGVSLSSGGQFVLLLAPGEYPDGLKLNICDMSHKRITLDLNVTSLKAGEVYEAKANWSPSKNLLFYEGFDNFAWGGDYVGGSSTFGFSPDGVETSSSYGSSLTGYEHAFKNAEYTWAGSGYIQGGSLSQASGKTVEGYHSMSGSYVRSRNLGDYLLLHHCQEYQGYLGVGTADATRGIFQAPDLGISELCDLEISFDYCPRVGFKDQVCLETYNSGIVSSVTVDGEQAVLDNKLCRYEGCGGRWAISAASVPVPTSTPAAKQWRHVVMYVENVNNATQIRLTTALEEGGYHGFYLDNVSISIAKYRRTPVNGIRILYWNIQCGMWSDQANNYNNFVAWLNKYKPDVCVFCEARSLYDEKGEWLKSSARTLESGWPALAKRYGHNYTMSCQKDNYPEMITSKYPIIKLKELETSEVAHGAAVVRVTIGGKDLHFLSTHLWPADYARGIAESERPASQAAREGDIERENEMKSIVNNLLSDYSGVDYLFMMGDFNCPSSVDEWYYNKGASHTDYLAQNYLRKNSNLIDVIGEYWPGNWLSSVNKDFERMDMFYATPKAYEGVQNAMIIVDDWTLLYQDNTVSGYFCRPSDHRPVLVDVKY